MRTLRGRGRGVADARLPSVVARDPLQRLAAHSAHVRRLGTLQALASASRTPVQRFPLGGPGSGHEELPPLDTEAPDAIRAVLETAVAAGDVDTVLHLHAALLEAIGGDQPLRVRLHGLLTEVGDGIDAAEAKQSAEAERLRILNELLAGEATGSRSGKPAPKKPAKKKSKQQKLGEREERARKAAAEALRTDAIRDLQVEFAGQGLDPVVASQVCGAALADTGTEAHEVRARLTQRLRAQMAPDLGDWKTYLGLNANVFLQYGNFENIPIHVSVFHDAIAEPGSLLDHGNTAIVFQMLGSADMPPYQRLHASIEHPGPFAPNKPRYYFADWGDWDNWSPGAFHNEHPERKQRARKALQDAVAWFTGELATKVEGARRLKGNIQGRVYQPGDENA